MQITIAAVGRLGPAPENYLARDYAKRAAAAGRGIALNPVEIVELEPRKPGKAAEAEVLRWAAGEGAYVIACDERGRAHPSRGLAEKIRTLRDRGERKLVFMIGGADGLDPALVEEADDTLAFGPQTWPHALARLMLAEQVYRAVTILSGSPYHRD